MASWDVLNFLTQKVELRLHQILVNGSGQWSALGPGFIRFKTEHGHVLRRRGDGFSIPLVGIGDEVRSEMFLQAERTIADIATKTGMKDYNRMYLDMFFLISSSTYTSLQLGGPPCGPSECRSWWRPCRTDRTQMVARWCGPARASSCPPRRSSDDRSSDRRTGAPRCDGWDCVPSAHSLPERSLGTPWKYILQILYKEKEFTYICMYVGTMYANQIVIMDQIRRDKDKDDGPI